MQFLFYCHKASCLHGRMQSWIIFFLIIIIILLVGVGGRKNGGMGRNWGKGGGGTREERGDEGRLNLREERSSNQAYFLES